MGFVCVNYQKLPLWPPWEEPEEEVCVEEPPESLSLGFARLETVE